MKICLSFLAFLLITSCSSKPQRTPANGEEVLPVEVGRMTFQDEFESGLPKDSHWNRSYVHGGVINNELQYYAPDAFTPGEGFTRIRAERRNMNGFKYTSGAMTTFGKFAQTYGYFEMRARLPDGNGYWPAFWILPNNLEWPPEIDIFEQLGQDRHKIYFTQHWNDEKGVHRSKGVAWEGPDFTEDFHTFGLEWRPNLLVWYVDGIERFRRTTNVPDYPMYILANLTVGGSWPVPPDHTTPFPGYFDIDYIRAYELEGVKAPPLPPYRVGPATASTYKVARGKKVTFSVGLELTEKQPGFIFQAVLYDHTEKITLASEHQFTASRVGPGSVRKDFTMQIPKDTKPGIYHLSFGNFREKDGGWQNLNWISNAVMIEVTE